MLPTRFRVVRERTVLERIGLRRGFEAVARSVALFGLLAGAGMVTPGEAGASPERTVLDIGGRVIAFEAKPAAVTEFTLPFEAGNALLLQDALQRLRQPDLGPFGSSNGAVLHVVSVGGDDRKLAFERARTIRAALVRLGAAEPRGLAAAATGGDVARSANDARVETVTVTVSRLTRAGCAACSTTTLGTAAMDTGAVGLATIETGSPANLAATTPARPTSPTASTADRREPDTNLSFTDRPALATSPQAAGISQSDQRALGTVAGAAAAAAPPAAAPPRSAAPVPPARDAVAPERAGRGQVARVAPAARVSAPRARVSGEAVKLADLRALGRASAPGCRPRIIVIDDYLPPQQGWTCGRR